MVKEGPDAFGQTLLLGLVCFCSLGMVENATAVAGAIEDQAVLGLGVGLRVSSIDLGAGPGAQCGRSIPAEDGFCVAVQELQFTLANRFQARSLNILKCPRVLSTSGQGQPMEQRREKSRAESHLTSTR